MTELRRIDFHSHILPEMDDGAYHTDESLQMLKMLKDDGVSAVVATPHLYLHRESVGRFLQRREKCAFMLREAIEESGLNLPEVIIGAEVYYGSGLGNLPLDELCIEGTDYLLLELPYAVFSTNFINSFKNYLNFCDVNVVLAHIERYYDYNMPERVEEILSLGLLSQANCDSVVSVRSRRRTLELIRSGKIGLLGTDLHSLDERPPRFAEAEKIIRKKLSDSAFEQMMATAAEILNR